MEKTRPFEREGFASIPAKILGEGVPSTPHFRRACHWQATKTERRNQKGNLKHSFLYLTGPVDCTIQCSPQK